MARLNYSSGLFKGNIEENRFQKFLREDGFLKYFLNNSASFGILKKPSDPNFSNFKVESGTNAGTVKIGVESDAIDSNGNLIKKEAEDNIALPSADTWYWAKISYLESSLEKGTISISTNGTITGIGTEFTKLIRGGKYTFSKVKFESSLNTLEYQVVEVIDDLNMLISGVSFDAETNIKFSVVGTFTPDSVPTESQKFPFRYDSSTLEFIEETTLNTAPAKAANEYYIARIRNSGGNISIEDKRTDFWRTKADAELGTITNDNNPLIGIESIKFASSETPRDHNLVNIAWGFRSSNFTLDSSLNKLTLSGGSGGIYKDTDAFATADFNGWRLYWSDGTYSKVNSSILISSQINIVLDNLDPKKAVATTEILLVPDVESIVLELKATNNTPLQKKEYEFPINIKVATILAPLYDVDNSTYTINYKYKKHNVYSAVNAINDDAVGYYSENSFEEDGVLKALEDRIRQTVTGAAFTLIPAGNNYFSRINSIDTGDVLGVNSFNLSNASPIVNFTASQDKKVQNVLGTIALTVDHYFNIETAGAIEGNVFEFIFNTALDLNGNILAITQDYVNSGDVGTVLFNFDDFYSAQASNDNLVVKLIFDGTNWVTNNIVSLEKIENGWLDPTLNANWVNNDDLVSGGRPPVKYRKNPLGFIEFKGFFRNVAGNGTNPAFTLPVGFRPIDGVRAFPTTGNGVNGGQYASIDTNGNVSVFDNNLEAQNVNMDGIFFWAD